MPTKEFNNLSYIKDIQTAREIQKSLRFLKDKISKSPEFLLLFGKTQMFYGDKGRSRGGHSRNIGKSTKEIVQKTFKETYKHESEENPELYDLNLEITSIYAEIMGLCHDLGHTPLGHDGESVLNNKLFEMTENDDNLRQQVLAERQALFSGVTMEIDEKTAKKMNIEPGTYKYEDFQELKRQQKGERGIGYEHNEYGVQIFANLFKELKEELKSTKFEEGINKIDVNRFITAILAHSRSRFPAIPEDYLAQALRQADKVEYMNYDFEEYYQMGCFPLQKTNENDKEHEVFNKILKQRAEEYGLPEEEVKKYISLTAEEKREIIEDGIVEEVLQGKGKIDDKMSVMNLAKICADFKDDTLFFVGQDGKRGLITGNNVERQETIIEKLFEYYKNNPDRIPKEEVITKISPINADEISDVQVVSFSPLKASQNSYEQLKTYIASLTNQKCEDLYQELVQERIEKGEGFGISPVTQQDIDKKLEENRNGKRFPSSLVRAKNTYSYLPKEIKQLIKENRILHKEQVREDEVLHEKMIEADRKRETIYVLEDFAEMLRDRTKGEIGEIAKITVAAVRGEEQLGKETVTVGEDR